MKQKTNSFIKEFLDSNRITAKGTWRYENSIVLARMIFDEILNSSLVNIDREIPLWLYLCDTYNMYSSVVSIRHNGTKMGDYLIFDQHIDIINRILNSVYLSSEDSGHDIWKIAYELFLEESVLIHDKNMAIYFGMNKIALGEYYDKSTWFSDRSNFLSFVQMAFIMAHEIGHWLLNMNREGKQDELNIKDDINSTKNDIRIILEETYSEYENRFKDKEYFGMVIEQKELINDYISEECFSDAFAISAVLTYVDCFSKEDMTAMIGEENPRIVAIQAILLLMMNLQVLSMARMSFSDKSFENQSSIRLSFFRNYAYLYFQDMLEEFNECFETTAMRYEERIVDIIIEAFSELSDRMENLKEYIKNNQLQVDYNLFLDL